MENFKRKLWLFWKSESLFSLKKKKTLQKWPTNNDKVSQKFSLHLCGKYRSIHHVTCRVTHALWGTCEDEQNTGLPSRSLSAEARDIELQTVIIILLGDYPSEDKEAVSGERGFQGLWDDSHGVREEGATADSHWAVYNPQLSLNGFMITAPWEFHRSLSMIINNSLVKVWM